MSQDQLVSDGSLSNIRVLDLTRVWAGPLATRIMGDFGAEIIKISDPRVPLLTPNGLNNKLNRNKKNIGIRLDIESGRDVFLDLVSKSDVVIENFRPRVMRNLKLDFGELKKSNPNIVMVSMPGFGLTGPYAEYPAYGTTAEALAGIPSLIGYSDQVPIATGIAYGDPVSGLNAVTLILAALRKREKFGVGQFIEIALSASPLCNIGEYIGSYSSTGIIPKLDGNRLDRFCPNGAFKCKGDDNWIAISVTDDKKWNSLYNILQDNRIKHLCGSDIEERKQNENLIIEVVEEWTSDRDAAEIASYLQNEGIPAGTVSSSQQLLNDPHLNERGFFFDTSSKQHDEKRFDGQSIPGNSLPKSSWIPASDVGEDSEIILNEILGYTKETCNKLRKELAVHFG